MLGTADHGALCAAIPPFIDPATRRGITAEYGLSPYGGANAVGARDKALRRLAGIFQVGFGIRPGAR